MAPALYAQAAKVQKGRQRVPENHGESSVVACILKVDGVIQRPFRLDEVLRAYAARHNVLGVGVE